MIFYRFTAGKFLEWIERQGLTGPEHVAARHVRQYLAQLAAAGRADTTMQNLHTKAARAWTKYSYHQGIYP